jgi:hypothetical protein
MGNPSPRNKLSSPRMRGSSTPRLLGSIIGVSGILGRPVKPGDDSCVCVCILAARCARGRGEHRGKVQISRDTMPAAASSTTTIHGGHFQTVSSRKPASASAKSRGVKTALVQTGL